jgi:hypothetical protein
LIRTFPVANNRVATHTHLHVMLIQKPFL